MRLLPVLLVSCLAILFLPASAAAEITVFEPYWMPEEPKEGSEFILLVVVRDAYGNGPSDVRVEFTNDTFDMLPAIPDPTSERWKEGVIFKAAITLEESGTHNFTIIAIDTNGSKSSTGTLNLTLQDKGDEGENTILGMPRSYCSISIIFITLMIIFLTYSYFKGRRMQKGQEAVSGASKVACSDCGKAIDPADEKCPHCGAVFEEEEHLCGKCGKVISKDDKECPHCGIQLKTFVSDLPKKNKKADKDLEKLKRKKIDMHGKVKCKGCGAVYLEKESRCPECGKKG
jgi:rubrerythrin